jgi:hypothetical protein
VEYVRALEARGIEHVLVGSKSFHRREEIGTIRAALRAIEWPDDELSVYAVPVHLVGRDAEVYVRAWRDHASRVRQVLGAHRGLRWRLRAGPITSMRARSARVSSAVCYNGSKTAALFRSAKQRRGLLLSFSRRSLTASDCWLPVRCTTVPVRKLMLRSWVASVARWVSIRS